ncbi:MAG: transcriptional regulator [Halioglobus sp.]
MYTIIETPTFKESADKLWSDDERYDFLVWLASNPECGAVIPGSGGCRKVRWASSGAGKRGGVRIIYFNKLQNGEIWLLLMYKKAVLDTIPAHILKEIRKAVDNDQAIN